MAIDQMGAQRLMLVEPIVRRVLVGRVRADVVDDLVQDTVERLVPVAQRLPIEQLTPYAVVAAQNAARSRLRRDSMARRLQTEMMDRDWAEGPEHHLVAADEATAVARALATLDVEDQNVVRAHHLAGEGTASIAERSGRTEMAVRVHLARARAKLRVAYAVEDAGTPLTSQRCARVLEALAMGDRRGQARIGVQDHIEGCPTCAALVAPVTGASRPAVGIFAAALLWWRTASTGAHSAVLGSVGVVVVGAVAVLAAQGPAPAREQAVPATTTVVTTTTTTVVTTTTTTVVTTTTTTTTPPPAMPGRIQTSSGALSSSPEGLAGLTGPVSARSVPVLSVPADEGFWIAADDGGQLWVELVEEQGESAVSITPGALVSFDGSIVDNEPGMVDRLGLAATEGSDQLAEQMRHLQVAADAVRLG